IAAQLLATRGHLAGARLLPLLDAADRWHAWFATARNDPKTGAIGVVHPWESGRDNVPDWDSPLAAVSADNVTPFERRDLSHIDAAMRPTKAQYDRYIALVEFGRSVGWDQVKLRDTSPFFVCDPGMTAILMRAERALIALSEANGRDDIAQTARTRLGDLEKGLDALWSDTLGAFTTLDTRTGHRGEYISSASFLSFVAGPLDGAKTQALTAHFDRMRDACQYMVPSYDPAAPAFDEKRYWRGPVWLVVNWLIAMGFEERGDTDRAAKLRADSHALVMTGGFHEYYSPLDGAPLGGGNFTWTAAAWLDWARNTNGTD
ncbi:MAG: hypothetical protein AAGD34_16125, partial [Pseudomonadota bacterium]